MSYREHMRGYDDIRTLYQIESLYKWQQGIYFPPVLVEISPTHMCNQHCRYCYADKGGNNKDIMSDELLVRSFEQVADAGVKAVFIQGTGEPLIHKALPEAISMGAAKGLSMGLTTNGVLLTPELQDQILEHLFFIRFSVLDTDAQRYAFQHNCPTRHWEDLMRNLENAVNIRSQRNLKTGLWATIYLFKENFAATYEMVKYFKELGLDYILIQEPTYTELSPCGKQDYFSSQCSPSEIEDMKAQVMTLRDENFEVKVRFPINDESYSVGTSQDCWLNDYCHGVSFYSIISSDGEVYPCWRMWGKKEFSFGSLYEKSFDDIWRGTKRTEVTKYLNTTAPEGDECSVCNLGKLNSILNKLQSGDSKWKDFLI